MDIEEKIPRNFNNIRVDLGDMVEARKLIRILNQDSNFYTKCSIETK